MVVSVISADLDRWVKIVEFIRSKMVVKSAGKLLSQESNNTSSLLLFGNFLRSTAQPEHGRIRYSQSRHSSLPYKRPPCKTKQTWQQYQAPFHRHRFTKGRASWI